MFPNPPFNMAPQSMCGAAQATGGPKAHLLHSSPPRLEAGPSQSSPCQSPGLSACRVEALGSSHSVMQTASYHCLALFKGAAVGVL